MANCEWKGNALTVAMVRSETPAIVEIGDIFDVIMGRKIVSYTATANTVANVTAGLTAAWNASTEPEHTLVTAADDGPGNKVTLTADTPGRQFIVTTNTTDGGGNDTQTLTDAVDTANSGPSEWTDVENWSDHDADGIGELPVASDTVYIQNDDSDITWGLEQSAVDLAACYIDSTFTGTIGLPDYDSDNSYPEYMPTYLELESTAWHIGLGEGTGSGRIKIDGNVHATAFNVYKTGSRLNTGVPCLLLKAVNAANVLNNYGGDVGVAFFAGEASTFLTIYQEGSASKTVLGSGVTHQAGGTITVEAGTLTAHANAVTASVNGGAATFNGTITTLNQTGGTVEAGSTITTINQSGGTCTVDGNVTTAYVAGGTLTCHGTMGTITVDKDATVTLYGNVTTCMVVSGTVTIGKTATVGTLLIEGGTVYYETSGTLGTALTVLDAATIDFRNDARSRTITPKVSLYSGASLYDPAGTIAWTAGFQTVNCDLTDLRALQVGKNYNFALS